MQLHHFDNESIQNQNKKDKNEFWFEKCNINNASWIFLVLVWITRGYCSYNFNSLSLWGFSLTNISTHDQSELLLPHKYTSWPTFFGTKAEVTRLIFIVLPVTFDFTNVIGASWLQQAAHLRWRSSKILGIRDKGSLNTYICSVVNNLPTYLECLGT